MSVDKKMTIIIICVLGIAFASGLVLWYLMNSGPWALEGRKTQEVQVRLLCETNYQALLEACREVSRMVARGELEKHQYMIRWHPDPATSRFPQVILDLEPIYVSIDEDGRVLLELGGGLGHFGVWAYPEEYKPHSSHYQYGDKKLIEGLWYDDEEYERSAEYRKHIDVLIQKGKARQIRGAD